MASLPKRVLDLAADMRKFTRFALVILPILLVIGCQNNEQKEFETNLIELHSRIVKPTIREHQQYVQDLKTFIQSNIGRQVSGWTCKQSGMQDICLSDRTGMRFYFKKIDVSQERFSEELVTFSGRIQDIETSMGIGMPNLIFDSVAITAVKKR